MRKEFKNKFIVYSHTLDRFIPIKKIPEEELESLVKQIIDVITTPKFSITGYVTFILENLVVGYDHVIKGMPRRRCPRSSL